ncbi:MAG: triose-phosphate isomerase [Candidatus Omnitrophica bacterium]|nr:triose-phosphate isomerase [Candidatus Omnitrophota bacterium]
MSRRPVVAGNWKMHGTSAAATALAQDILRAIGRLRRVDIILCPPFTALPAVARVVKRRRVALGAQDCHWAEQGAFTGEVSVPMLQELGATHCIIGHSERRRDCGETDAAVARKVQAVVAHGLTPIVCVGETLQERDAGRTLEVVGAQLTAGLQPVTPEQAPRLIVAYEPVWAIGTGRNATPAQAQEVHACLRQRLAARFTPAIARQIRIQYGGSVKPDNSAELIAQPDVDGFLVGGASLDAAQFAAIIRAAAGVPAPATT